MKAVVCRLRLFNITETVGAHSSEFRSKISWFVIIIIIIIKGKAIAVTGRGGP
jgi:hypothetical protein